MRAWSSGVVVVTALYNGEQHGMTVSSFTSISLDPPLVIISLQIASRTHQMISESGEFAVTILSENQKDISERFAGRVPDEEDRLVGLEMETLVSGAPLLKDGLAWLDCRVIQIIPAGTNTLFLAQVIVARSNGEGMPLIYHDRLYWMLKK